MSLSFFGGIRKIFIEILFVVFGFAVVLLLDNRLIATGIVGTVLVLRFIFWSTRRQKFWFFLYGPIWAVIDIIFMQFRLSKYPEGDLFGQPLYMPFLFGQLAVLAGVVFEVAGGLDRPSKMPFWLDSVLLILSTLTWLLLHPWYENTLVLIFSGAFVIRALVDGKDRVAFVLALCVGFFEPLIELILVILGLFEFNYPGDLIVPNWFWPYFALISYPLRRVFSLVKNR